MPNCRQLSSEFSLLVNAQLQTAAFSESQMGYENWFRLLLFFPIFGFLSNYLLLRLKRRKNLPPGPRALPIIGHLHLFKPPIHRTLQDLSLKYGPVMFLQLGTRRVVVVSSAEAVQECFTKNDIVFANRPRLLAGKLLSYNYRTIPSTSYGDHWRNLRRLATLELLSLNRLTLLKSIREEEVHFLLKQIYESSSDLRPVKVELRSKFKDLSFNIIMRMMAGKRYYGKGADGEEAKEFRDITIEVLELVGVSNLVDFLPAFQWVDIQGIKKRMATLNEKKDNFYQKLVDESRKSLKERIEASNDPGESQKQRTSTLIDVMLSLQQIDPENYPDLLIKVVIQSLIIAGTDTSTSTVEWAMALLLNHPEAKKKVLAEIESCVGHGRLLDENDLPKLKYLQNVINETLRLFPPVPLLVPHESSDDCKVCGFHIPQGTILMANIWSIQRDPKLWEDSTSFKPERFDGWENDGYKFIPFGAGRRACPGTNLGKRVVALAVGTLIQSFDWERERSEEIDMTEGKGLTLPKKEPLEALCKPRESMIHLLSQL